MDGITLSFMEKNDIHESARILSVAMLNNPLHVAVFQGKGEKERLEIEKMFFELFMKFPGIVFLAKEKQHIIGVMRMKSCKGGKMADAPKTEKNETDIEWRKSLLYTDWSRNDPLEQHWHLGPIGVLPTHQGAGIGSALLERFCREVDACLAKAFLETDMEKNVRFYEKFGFNVVSESKIFDVKNRYMLRAPRL